MNRRVGNWALSVSINITVAILMMIQMGEGKGCGLRGGGGGDLNCSDGHCPNGIITNNGLGGAAQNDCNGFPEWFPLGGGKGQQEAGRISLDSISTDYTSSIPFPILCIQTEILSQRKGERERSQECFAINLMVFFLPLTFLCLPIAVELNSSHHGGGGSGIYSCDHHHAQ